MSRGFPRRMARQEVSSSRRGMGVTGGRGTGHLFSFFLVSSFGQCLLQQVQVATGCISSGDTIPNFEKLSMVSPELRVPGTACPRNCVFHFRAVSSGSRSWFDRTFFAREGTTRQETISIVRLILTRRTRGRNEALKTCESRRAAAAGNAAGIRGLLVGRTQRTATRRVPALKSECQARPVVSSGRSAKRADTLHPRPRSPSQRDPTSPGPASPVRRGRSGPSQGGREPGTRRGT